MTHLLRGKQAGVQSDLSQGISAALFMPDDIARYGINSLLSAMAYDPVQSLLAVGTSESQFGPGQIYVYGQKQVCVTFKLPRRASAKELQFCANRLICLNSKNDVSVYNLETKKMVVNYTPPGHVTTLLTDHHLDYCLTGLQSGQIIAYDLDREIMTPFRIPNLWQQQYPKARILSIVSLQFHPKDIGTLLIGYPDGAVLYSFKQNKAIKFFAYEVPRGAPGGDGNPANTDIASYPRLTHAVWHPTGTFILTAHDDSSLVVWDPRDGRLVTARSIQTTGVNLPSSRMTSPGVEVKEPYTRIAWCSKENPDDTGLLIAGGTSTTNPAKGLTWMELGPTPNYQTSSWDILADHFRNPKRVSLLSTPPNAQVTNFLLIPRSSPHYAGSHDPIALLATLSSGELITLSFPSGHPITPTNQLHVSLTYVHPYITKFAIADVDRTRWMGMRESRQHGPNFLAGGAEANKPLRRFEGRNIVQMAHADGTIRVWDAGHGDEIENSIVLQADLAKAVGRWDNIAVAKMSMSGVTTELSVGLLSGEVVVFRYNRNQNFGKPPGSSRMNEGPGKMTDISTRADPDLKEGLVPLTLTNDEQGPVTALKHSDVGFVAAGYEGGGITIIDLRGPVIIYTALISELIAKHRKGSIKGSIRGRSDSHSLQKEWATTLEFGVMTLEGDDYSSVALFAGTNRGRVATFKILPSQTGRYTAEFAGQTHLSDDSVLSICPIFADSGSPANATGRLVAGLQSGQRVDGVLVVTTISSAHIFRPTHAKGASKTFDNVFCDSAAIARFENRGYALLGIFGDGTARAYSLPGLKEVGTARINQFLDVKRFGDAIVTSNGDVLGWTGPSEMALINVWGAGQPLAESQDRLYDPLKPPLPRPTISNLQWIAGTQYITPTDMDILIGGPGRPPSKRMIAEMRAQKEAELQKSARSGTSSPSQQSQETYWAYMQRQVQERTEALGLTGDSMERTSESTNTWSEDVSKYVAKQKRQAALGFIGSKFGL